MPMTWTYKLIKTLFKMTSGAFYATIELRGEENIPKPGEACILCFNHGNGLADPKLIIRATPRMVRFSHRWEMALLISRLYWDELPHHRYENSLP